MSSNVCSRIAKKNKPPIMTIICFFMLNGFFFVVTSAKKSFLFCSLLLWFYFYDYFLIFIYKFISLSVSLLGSPWENFYCIHWQRRNNRFGICWCCICLVMKMMILVVFVIILSSYFLRRVSLFMRLRLRDDYDWKYF